MHKHQVPLLRALRIRASGDKCFGLRVQDLWFTVQDVWLGTVGFVWLFSVCLSFRTRTGITFDIAFWSGGGYFHVGAP